MATQQDRVSFHIPSELRRTKISRRQKKEELEREVSMLQKLLKQEKPMHEILGPIHHDQDGSAISIPSFLPPKTTELLAELAMVEGEIGRLEGEINKLKLGLKQEHEITKETKSKQWQLGSLTSLQWNSTNVPNSSPTRNEVGNEKVAFETKALHFISKAIKGDYTLSDFSTVNDQKKGNPTIVFVDQKENNFRQVNKFQDDKVPKKGGMIKPPSPLRDPRHPSPKPRERNYPENSFDLPPKSLSSSILLEESIQNWEPNKLSESILKCLNFIYIRLLRTSRAIELEKSGPISRSMNTSLISRRVRADTSLNKSSTNNILQKDPRQQDPYGIFDMEESIPRDVGPYKNLVRFSASSMDPKCISSSSSILLLRKLKVLMTNLQTVDLKVLTYQQKFAFWINMFNACMMHGFLQYGVPNSPDKLIALMNKATLSIGGNSINSQAIENYILRGPAVSFNTKEFGQKGENDDTEAIVRKLYGLESTDPNVTFALCYGTRSSPAVRIYTAEGIVSELEKSKLEYLQASIAVTNSRKIAFPELLLRNLSDFAMDIDSLVEWVCYQLPTSGTLRKSMLDCFRQQGHSTGKVSPTIEKIPYDFEFQYLLAI